MRGFWRAGRDVLGCLRDKVFEASQLVSLNGINKQLKGIQPRAGGGLRIGALTTLTEIAEDKQILQLSGIGAGGGGGKQPQLRNQGDAGGNLCQRPRCLVFPRGTSTACGKGGEMRDCLLGKNQMHAILGGAPCFMVHPSDTASALVALDAKVSIAGRRGLRQIPLASFFVLPKVSVVKRTCWRPGRW